MAFYGQDLAFVHEVGFGAVAESAADRLLVELGRRGLRGLVVDVGCGPGALARRLTRAGHPVLGIDVSPAMIRLARRRAPRAEFVCAPLGAAVLPPCDAIAATGEVLGYMAGPERSRATVRRFVRRAFAALRPGGVLLIDVPAPGRVPRGARHRGFRAGRGWAVLSEVRDEGRLRIREIVTFRRTSSGWRRTRETHRLLTFAPATVEDALRGAGFRVRPLRAYRRGVPLAPGVSAFLALKPRNTTRGRAGTDRGGARAPARGGRVLARGAGFTPAPPGGSGSR